MKFQKSVSGLLTCGMIATAICTGSFTQVNAATQPEPVVSYDFNSKELEDGVSKRIKELKSYDGDTEFDTGRSGSDSDKAVKLGNYGLELPQKNLGNTYTVSLWVKPTSSLKTFSPVLFLGYHDPEKWCGIAGAARDDDNTDGECILWGGSLGITGADEPHVYAPLNEWTMFTVAQTGSSMDLYKNGEFVKTLNLTGSALDGEKQGIYIGVNYWDTIFHGLVDDITIYDQELTASQIRYLYDNKGEEEIFDEQGFTVPAAITVSPGQKRLISAKLPSAVEHAEISYVSGDESVASVTEDGIVTGVKTGTAAITVTVKVGSTEKKKTTTVTVTEAAEKNVVVNYDVTRLEHGVLQDISGNGNDAAVAGSEGITFTEDTVGGERVTVMNMASQNSYIKLPAGIMDSLTDKEQFTIEATFAKSASCGTNAWLFCLGSKIEGDKSRYLFLSPNFGSAFRTGIRGNSEILLNTSVGAVTDVYTTVELVFDHGLMQLYCDGELSGVGQSGYSILNDVVTPGTSDHILGYIGQSCYAGDGKFEGKIASFKIYDGNTHMDTQLESLTEDDFLGKNVSSTRIKYDLSLPESVNGYQVQWTSDKTDVISNRGMVTNPQKAETVHITASISSGFSFCTKTYELTVAGIENAELLSLLLKAEKYQGQEAFLTDAAKTELKAAIVLAKAAQTQMEVDEALKHIKEAFNHITFNHTYFTDPFEAIDESQIPPSLDVKVDGSAVISIPEAVRDVVTVAYSSENNEIASIDASGKIIGKKPGYARILTAVTSIYDGFTMEYQTLVKVVGETVVMTTGIDLKGVTVAASASSLAKGTSAQITVNYPDTVKSANPTVSYTAKGSVSVNANGKVTAKKAGKGTVSVKIKTGVKSITKRVVFQVGEISGNSKVKVKKSITLKVKGISGKVKWFVNKKKLASISSKGKFKAKKAGTVKVTAKIGNITLTKTITIKKK